MSEKALSMKEYIEEAEAALLHTYNRYQVVLDKGDGVYLYDMEGKNTWISAPASLFLPWAITTGSITMH